MPDPGNTRLPVIIISFALGGSRLLLKLQPPLCLWLYLTWGIRTMLLSEKYQRSPTTSSSMAQVDSTLGAILVGCTWIVDYLVYIEYSRLMPIDSVTCCIVSFVLRNLIVPLYNCPPWDASSSLQGVLTVQVYHYYEIYPSDRRTLKFLASPICFLRPFWHNWPWSLSGGSNLVYFDLLSAHRMHSFINFGRLLDFFHLVLIVHATYFYLITSWGSEVSELRPTITFDLNCAINGIATFACQSFFVYRWVPTKIARVTKINLTFVWSVWILSSKNVPLVGILVIGSLSTLGLEILMSERLSAIRYLTSLGSFTSESASLFSINTAGAKSRSVLL